jgi:hypothetical protein
MHQIETPQKVLTEQEKFARIREYVDIDSPTAHYPVPAEWVEWLLTKYAGLVNAIVPLTARKYVSKPFANADDVMKLTMVYREVEGANSCGMPTPMVPGSWVAWLLAAYERHIYREKVDSILSATENGAQLSLRDLEIVSWASRGGLSQSGLEEFEALHENVLSGLYLDPNSSKFPWYHGIIHLSQDHAGYLCWKGQKVSVRPFSAKPQFVDIPEVKQLEIDCIAAEATGSHLPGASMVIAEG